MYIFFPQFILNENMKQNELKTDILKMSNTKAQFFIFFKKTFKQWN